MVVYFQEQTFARFVVPGRIPGSATWDMGPARMVLVPFIIVLCCGLGVCFDRSIPYNLKPNYGVFFRPLGDKLYASQSFIKTVFVLDRPKWPKLYPLQNIRLCRGVTSGGGQNFMVIDQSSRRTVEITDTNKLRFACEHIEIDINRRIDHFNSRLPTVTNATTSLNYLIKQSSLRNDTSRRAILGFLGEGLASILGLSTEKQIQNLFDHIKILQSNSHSMVSETKQIREMIGKVVTTSNERFKRVWNALKESNDMLNKTIMEAHAWQQKVRDSFQQALHEVHAQQTWILDLLDLSVKIESLIQDQSEFLAHVNLWIDAMMTLGQNRLPIGLISPSLLSDHLRDVSRLLSKKSVAQRLIHGNRDLAFYYKQKIVTFVTFGVNIYIHLQVPVGDRNLRLNIYHVGVFPVPAHRGEDSTSYNTGYTKLEIESTYLAVTANKEFYQVMGVKDLQVCRDNLFGECPVLGVLRDRSDMACQFALFVDDLASITAKCDFRYYKDDLPEYILKVVDSTYLVASPRNEFVVSCKHSRKHYEATQYMVLTLPCACQINLAEFYVPESLTDCPDVPEVKIGYPINLAQVTAFQLELQSSAKVTSVMPIFNTTPVLQIPNISQWKGFENMSEYDRKAGVSLGKMAQELIDKPIYYLEDNIGSPFGSVFDTVAWEYIVIMCVSLFWFVLNSVLIILLYIKMKNMAAVIVLLEKVKLGKSKLITTSSNPISTTTSRESIDCSIGGFDGLAGIMAIVGLLVIIVLLYKMYQFWIARGPKACPGCFSKVFLKVVNVKQSVEMELLNIPFPTKEMTAVGFPVVNLFEVLSENFCSVEVRVKFDGYLKIEAYGNSYNTRLPNKFRVFSNSAVLKEMYNRRTHAPMAKYIVIRNICTCNDYVTPYNV